MVQRVLIGKFPDGGIGLRVSEPGYDVMSNPVDNRRLYFSSDWAEVLPVLVRGTFNISTNQNSVKVANYTYPGYIPFARFFYLEPAATTPSVPQGWTFKKGGVGLVGTTTQGVSQNAALYEHCPAAAFPPGQGSPYLRFEVRADGIYGAYMPWGTGSLATVSVAYLLFSMRAL